jgi:His-Xaa-Ser system radical SAM maturase HxsC
MIQLLHKADQHSNHLNVIRKLVLSSNDFKKGDSIFFTNNAEEITEDIDLVITNSIELFEKFKENKIILYFKQPIEAIEDNAIVKIDKDILYFRYIASSTNSQALFFTKKCNHYCLMCSEPPSKDNFDFLIEENIKIVELLNKDTEVIVISGGEPTLLGKDFIRIIKRIREELPNTKIKLLTNGRSFANNKFCSEVAEIAKGYLTAEIPIYSTDYSKHDYIVQSKGAFFETIEGIYNCAIYDLNVEIRVVLTKQNYMELSKIVSYVYRNLPFVDHIALMGLEYIGLAIKNFEDIHISPLDYKKELYEAVDDARRYNLPISIYNLPLCLIEPKLKRYARQSISDWKNDFSDCCNTCIEKDSCCGMFSSTKPYFEKLLKPIL